MRFFALFAFLRRDPTLPALLISLVLATGCTKENETAAPPEKPALRAVTELVAYSASATSVVVRWSASPDSNLAEFQGYSITFSRSSGTPTTITLPKTAKTYTASNLTEGGIYAFEVMTRAVPSSPYRNSTPAVIHWSPARRLNDTLNAPIRVYESSSPPTLGSGLIFLDPVSSKPKVVSVANPGPDSLRIDVYVKTESNDGVTLRSANLYKPASRWRTTRFSASPPFFYASTLDDPHGAPPDTNVYTDTFVFIDSAEVPNSRVYYFRGNDGNYGRIIVERNPDTRRLIMGTSPQQYLQVRLSYQTAPNNPYSKSIPVRSLTNGE